MPSGTYIRTSEIRLKNSLSNLGLISGFKNKTHSKENLKKISVRTCKAMTKEVRDKIRQFRLGKVHSLESRAKISKSNKGKTAGSKHYNWKGGKKIQDFVYNSFQYADWRKLVFLRDNYTCQICGSVNKRLHAHHILPKCSFPERMFDLDNGKTLCVDCHKTTNSYGINKKRNS